jgi:hypothetical protein
MRMMGSTSCWGAPAGVFGDACVLAHAAMVAAMVVDAAKSAAIRAVRLTRPNIETVIVVPDLF